MLLPNVKNKYYKAFLWLHVIRLTASIGVVRRLSCIMGNAGPEVLKSSPLV